MEIVAIIFYFISVYLTTKQNIWCWATGIVGVSLYLILFLQIGIIAQAVVQGIFIIQSIYGWWNWKQGKKESLKPSWLSNKNRLFSGVILITIIGILYLALSNVNTTLPLLDAIASSCSLIANWLTTKKKIDSWYIWIFTNIVLISIFIMSKMYLSICLYIIFIGFDIKGIKDWRKNK